MMRSLYLDTSGELRRNLDSATLKQVLADRTGTLWLDICFVDAEKGKIRDFLSEHFQFHHLTLDDALEEAHVARVDDWEDYLYIVQHAMELEVNRSLDVVEVDMFLGPNYLVTLHESPVQPLDQLWDRCQQDSRFRLKDGADHVFYLLTDMIISHYMPVVDGLDEEIDELEHEIFHRPRRTTITRIFRLRRTLLRMRRLVGYLRETMNRLARDPYSMIDAEDRVYFRDAYDHLVRLFEIIEGLRDMAAGALDSHLSVTSNRTNEVMRTLTIVTVLFLPLNFIAGYFGMNFFADSIVVESPLPSWLAFVLCMLGMLLSPLFLFWWMAKRGWLSNSYSDDDGEHEAGRKDDSSE
jgi:magnesium transporter